MFEGYTKVAAVDPAAVVTPDCYIGGTTSIFDPLAGKRPLTVFPNPANYSAEVSFQSQFDFDARLTLHSLGGSLISASMVKVQQGSNFYFLDVASLPTGSYFVRLENKFTGKAEVVKLSVAR